MIDAVFNVVREELNDQLVRDSAAPADDGEDRVVFPSGEKPEPEFRLGAVTMLLANVEEEATLRPPDRFSVRGPDGAGLSVHPPVRLNLFALFVARHRSYAQSLRSLSLIVRWFRRRRVLAADQTTGLPAGIDRLVMDLVTLPFGEQNDVWSALRSPYMPSVLYRIGVVTFVDEAPGASPEISEVERRFEHIRAGDTTDAR